MLRCVRVFNSVKALHIASCYAVRVCFNSVKALHLHSWLCYKELAQLPWVSIFC